MNQIFRIPLRPIKERDLYLSALRPFILGKVPTHSETVLALFELSDHHRCGLLERLRFAWRTRRIDHIHAAKQITKRLLDVIAQAKQEKGSL